MVTLNWSKSCALNLFKMTSMADERATRTLPATITPDSNEEEWNDGTAAAKSGANSSLLTRRTSNPRIMSFIRDDWIRKQMLEREAEFTAFRKMSVFSGTFNANGKKPIGVANGVIDWLRGGESQKSEALSDIYVIGFQEIVDLSAANVLADGQSAARTSAWAELIHKILNELAHDESQSDSSSASGFFHRRHDGDDFGEGLDSSQAADTSVGAYQLVETKHMVGIALMIFVKAEHVTYVQDVQGLTVGVGLMGVMGNKGACVIRMQVYDSTFCFVSAHLAAHRGNVQGRNADFASIMEKAQFKDDAFLEFDESKANATENIDFEPVDDVPSASKSTTHNDRADKIHGASKGTHKTAANTERRRNNDQHMITGSRHIGEFGIRDHDYVFWLGDLNYRMQKDVTLEECYDRIRRHDIAFLRANDQLNAERLRGMCFSRFEEGSLEFLPTYKYIPGTDRYDDREDKKMRVPAYCDRILWSCREGNAKTVEESSVELVELEVYNRSDILKISDHKPVFARFGVQCKTTIRAEQRKVYGEIMHALDKWENECIPSVEVDPTEIFFDKLQFQVRQTQKITITNNGQVSATFRFVPKLEEEHICKSWLSLKPAFGMLLPNESIDITVNACVDTYFANGLDYGREVLDDILIFSVENGRDHFFAVTGTYLPSCFGTSLARLVCTPGPMRNTNTVSKFTSNVDNSLTASSGISGAAPKAVLSVPTEIWCLVDALYRRIEPGEHLAPGSLEGLFVSNGSQDEIMCIRESLDYAKSLDDDLLESVSINSLAEALLQLLNSLSDVIVPVEFWPQADFDHSVPVDAWSSHFLSQMPTMNYNVFVYLVAFLRKVVEISNRDGGQGKGIAKRLSVVFARTMIRLPYLHSFWDYRVAEEEGQLGLLYSRGSSQKLTAYVGSGDALRNEREDMVQAARDGMHKVLHHFMTVRNFC